MKEALRYLRLRARRRGWIAECTDDEHTRPAAFWVARRRHSRVVADQPPKLLAVPPRSEKGLDKEPGVSWTFADSAYRVRPPSCAKRNV